MGYKSLRECLTIFQCAYNKRVPSKSTYEQSVFYKNSSERRKRASRKGDLFGFLCLLLKFPYSN